MAWVVVFCTIPQPAHACCKSADGKLNAEMPCCVMKSVAQLAERSFLDMPGLEPVVAPLVNVPAFDFTSLHSVAEVSYLASLWVPDQSGRYLDLRVLLN